MAGIDYSVYDRIAGIKPIEFNMPQMPTPFQRYEDESRIRGIANENKLNDLIAKHSITGKTDYNALAQEMAQQGMGSSIPKMQEQQGKAQKAQLEAQKLAIETGLKKLDYLYQNTSDWENKPVTPETDAAWQQHRAQLIQDVGMDLPELPPQYDPEGIKAIRARGLTAAQQHAEQWKALNYNMDVDKFGYQQGKDTRDFNYKQGLDAQQLGMQKRGQDITMRGQDQSAKNLQWYQAPGPDGLPVWKQGKEEGAKIYSPTGISNKNQMPAGQVDVIRGAKNTIDAIDQYKPIYEKFSNLDLLSPDKQVELKAAYKNVLLQAQQVYGLGVLNPNDERVLAEILTNPVSVLGTLASKEAMNKQIDSVRNIVAGMGNTASQNYTNAKPGQDASRFPIKNVPAVPKDKLDEWNSEYDKLYGGQ